MSDVSIVGYMFEQQNSKNSPTHDMPLLYNCGLDCPVFISPCLWDNAERPRLHAYYSNFWLIEYVIKKFAKKHRRVQFNTNTMLKGLNQESTSLPDTTRDRFYFIVVILAWFDC